MNIFGQGSFNVDPNMTPEQLARKRQQLANLVQGYGNERYVSTGVVDLLGGLLAGQRGRKLDTFEGDKTAQATAQYNALLGGGGAQPQMQPPAMQPPQLQGVQTPVAGDVTSMSLNDPRAIAGDAMAAIGQAPRIGGGSMSAQLTPDMITSGLVQRGLSPQAAQGVAMNMKDESGFNPAAVGDNGNALGLAQWNGPRKAALVQFAQGQGKDPTDPNVQMDFMMSELQGPEAGAGAALTAAPDAASAATAFLNKYERPAEVYRAQREAKYNGGVASPASGGVDQATIMQALANPWLSADQKTMLQGVLQQQMQRSDPMYQLQLQKAQADLKKVQDGTGSTSKTYDALMARALAAGLVEGTPEFQNFMLHNGNMASQEPKTYEALKMRALAGGLTEGSPEFQAFMVSNGQGPSSAASAAGTIQGTAQGNLPTAVQNAGQINAQISDVLNDPYLPNMVGPIEGRLSGWNMTSDAARVQAKINQLKGGAFLTAYSQLKGAGAITEIEGQKATAAMARMDQAQSLGDFTKALTDFRDVVNNGLARMQSQANLGGQPGASQPAPAQTDNVLTYDPATGTFK